MRKNNQKNKKDFEWLFWFYFFFWYIVISRLFIILFIFNIAKKSFYASFLGLCQSISIKLIKNNLTISFNLDKKRLEIVKPIALNI